MATDKQRIMVSLDDDLFNSVEKYRYEKKIATRSGATIELVKLGLEDLLREQEEIKKQRNMAPTAEDAAEALYEILYYYLGRPPKVEEVERLRDIVPVVCKGISSD